MSGLNLTLPQVLQRAFAAHQAGNAVEAERLYKRVIRAVPDQFDALHLLGVLKAERGFHGEADRLIAKALAVNPRSAEALNNRANVLQSLKRWHEALASCDRALAIKPDFAEALNNRGSVLHDLKRYDEAQESLQRSLSIQPRNFKALNNLGLVLLDLQRADEALASFDQALAIRPGVAEVWNNRGNALRAMQRSEEALACYEKSLEIQPRYVKALSNRGNLLHDLMRDDEALASLNQALAISPNLGSAHYDLGKALLFTGKRAEGEAHYQRALALDPDLIEARFGLCMAQLPIVYASGAEILKRRAAYEAELRKLSDAVDRGQATGDLMAGLGSHLPFYLAYQGRDDRELQRLYGSLACRIMADCYPPAPISGLARPGERIRVGFISAYFRHHSVWKMPIKGWLSQLDRGRLQIFGYHIGSERDGETELAASLCERFVQGPLSIEQWRKTIIADAPHVLIYPDIGMDGRSVQLAAQRLAPIQCNSWGHPVTSGMPTVDFYLSSDLMEPPDGQDHYTERLIRLPNLSVYYEPVEVKTIPVDRAQLGLRSTATVFWCAQSLYKYLPQYDQVFSRIARELADCQFVFLPYRAGTAVTEVFQQRLRDAFAGLGLSAADHCVFLPRLDQDRFVAALGQCDVFLDSIGWSGCNSTLESLAHDLPIVTLRGDLMRGRHSSAVLERIGVADTIAEGLDDYVSTAVRLGRDVTWRKAIKARIAESKHRIYRDRACISALEEFLDRVARRGIEPEGGAIGSLRDQGLFGVTSRANKLVAPTGALQAAILQHQKGQIAEAERLYQVVLEAEPYHSGALHHLGVAYAQQGRLEDAISLIQRALENDPHSAEAHNDLGVALEAAKRHAEAIPCYEKALALNPDYAEASFNLANALQALERHDEAIVRFERALALRPDHAETHSNLGKSLFALGQHREAIAHFERALASNSHYVAAEHNLGSALHKLGRYGEAVEHFQRALALKPGYAQAHEGLGNSLRQLRRFADALCHLEQAIALDPGNAQARYNLGSLLRELGRREEAVAHYERALELKPDLVEARFALCMAQLPILYRDEAELAERRSAYELQLRRLSVDIESGKIVGDLVEGVGSNRPFYLAYQGLNDRDLQSIYGALACRIMGGRYPPAPVSGPAGTGERIRVGFVSAYFHHHSVWKIPIKGWLSQLDRGRFQIFGYHTGIERDGETELAASLCERFVQGPLSIEQWREAIIADAPHVLIYPEIGMDGLTLQLAAQRLADVQCHGMGHPETSGLPTLDYCLSSELMEPADGQEHYTERLIRLPNLSVYYEPVEVKSVPVDRAQLGLRATTPVFWCAQSLYKYLPQYDRVYPLIARDLGDCQFVFVSYRTGTAVTEVFQRRLRDAFAAFGLSADRHCVFLPRLNQDRFVAAIGQCDIFLDSIGWSGNNSTSESLAHDLPIVTLRGNLMRGRHSAAILDRMGVLDTITDTVDDYISTAVRLGRDLSWRNAIKARIAQNKHRIYRDRACISALEEFLDRAARGAALPAA